MFEFILSPRTLRSPAPRRPADTRWRDQLRGTAFHKHLDA